MDDNWAALAVAIIKELDPEEALFVFDHGHRRSDSVAMTLRMGKLEKEMSRREIAHYYDTTLEAVQKRITRLDETIRQKQIREIREQRNEEITRLFQAGVTKTDIAKAFGVSYNTVKRVIGKE